MIPDTSWKTTLTYHSTPVCIYCDNGKSLDLHYHNIKLNVFFDEFPIKQFFTLLCELADYFYAHYINNGKLASALQRGFREHDASYLFKLGDDNFFKHPPIPTNVKNGEDSGWSAYPPPQAKTSLAPRCYMGK